MREDGTGQEETVYATLGHEQRDTPTELSQGIGCVIINGCVVMQLVCLAGHFPVQNKGIQCGANEPFEEAKCLLEKERRK